MVFRKVNILEYAFEKNIILTFPTSLLEILKGFSMTIQKDEIRKTLMRSSKYQKNFIRDFKLCRKIL